MNPSITYLEYWNGEKWIHAGGPFGNAKIAWISLGEDNLNYRTIGANGAVDYENGPNMTEDSK